MSDTPRTDAAVRDVDVAFVGHWGLSSEPQEFVSPEFTRELERELATEREKAERYRLVTLKQDAELAARKEELAQMRSVINEMADRFGRPEFKTRLFDDFMRMRRDLRRDGAAQKETKP